MKRRKKKRGKGKISKSTALVEKHKKVMKKTKAGSGKRFKALTEELSERKGVYNPKALAAYIGFRKYGKKKMLEMAQAGKKRKRRKK